MYSVAKPGYGEMDAPQTAQDQLHSQLNDLITALNSKNAPKVAAEKAKMVSTADPEDIYKARKELKDSLKMGGLSVDELSNAAKANRRMTMDVTGKMDKALDESSGGAFSKYLATHGEGMKPIEEGRAFQNILDKFDANPRILGTSQPQVTPYALRKAVEKETWKDLGKSGFVDKLSEGGRKKVEDAVSVMDAIEKAKKGIVSTTGSPTAPFLMSLANKFQGGSTAYKVLSLLADLGESRGQKLLDEALLNPENLQPLLDKAAKVKPAGNGKALANISKAITRSTPALSQIGRD
jgi:hypothetical protein